MNTHEAADAAWSEPTTPALEWRSGRWSLELRGDELADIAFDGRPSVRSIRGVARDRDWATIPSTVTAVDVTDERLVVDVELAGFGADLGARLVVEARGETLDVGWRCRANSDFLRARLGLVVLHPAEIAGEAMTVTHPGGISESSVFPVSISPHQPAFDIRSLAWSHSALATSLDFAGDVFEMEDQRNWTDASFKTYSTPLSLAFPVRVAAGETVEQSIRIHCATTPVPVSAEQEDRIELVPAGRAFPSVGTSASTGASIASPEPVGGFLLVELPAHTEAWRAALERAVVEAKGLPLDVRIVGATPQRLDEVLDAIAPLALLRVGAFDVDSNVSEPALWRSLLEGIAARGIAAEPVGGTRSHFTELNRNVDRLPDDVTAYAFSITPQMHATSREQIVESLEMQRLVAGNSVRLTGGPVHVGPITLRSRFNAVATTRMPDADVADLAQGYNAAVTAEATDPRQRSAALLAWTVASAAALAVEGVHSVSWFEASGPRGLRDVDGSELPVATALAWLGALSGAPLLEAAQHPPGLWAVGAIRDESSVVLVSNMRSTPALVTVDTPHGRERVRLAPFAARRLRIA